MNIREYNRSIISSHIERPCFVIHILFEWLVVFISYFRFFEDVFSHINNNFSNNSFFLSIVTHTHNRNFPYCYLYIPPAADAALT